MNVQDIQLMYEYNYWTNKKILGAGANIPQERFDASASPGDLDFTVFLNQYKP